MATGSLGTTSGLTTPSLTGSTPESEKNAELPENEKILSPDFLSSAQIEDLLAEDVDGAQEKLGIFLDFRNLKTSLKEAILLDYYVSGFLWAKGMDFSLLQVSKFMTLLDMLLRNLRDLRMSLEDSIKWLGEVMAEIGPNHSQKNEEWHIFDVTQANAIIDYLKISLFQHYRLYEFMFYSSRTEVVIGAEQVIEVIKSESDDSPFPAPLEEGIPLGIYSTYINPVAPSDTEIRGPDEEQEPHESQTEVDTSDVDPLVGFTIEDVKSVLAQVTDDVLTGVKAEINAKLQVQEDAFNARISKLRKA